jgi:hypothetical protein
MQYATFADVQLKYDQSLTVETQSRVEEILNDLSDQLDDLVPTLAGRIASGDDALARRARRVVRAAAIRELDNPRGYQGEHAGEVGYYYALGSGKDRTGPGKPFTEAELRSLRPAGRVRVGTIRARIPGDNTAGANRISDAPGVVVL